MRESRRRAAKRRGSQIEPPNRFEATRHVDDFEHLEHDELAGEPRAVPTQFLTDRTRTILAENDSPDVGFRYSINPYRGCEHGCAYCYARPTHETLGMNAGLDFETKVLVKPDAARLLREELGRSKWRPEPIALSGVTDCYQPIERRLRITRACLEVLAEAGNPAIVITKNALVLRDRDLLAEMARRRLVRVFLSVTTLDARLARAMEPRTSLPAARLEAVRALSAAGVPTGVMIAPVIPGLNETEIPALLAAAKEAGAAAAHYVLLRLPWSVLPVFRDWLDRSYPEKAGRVVSLLGKLRGGRLNDSSFGTRMRGTGIWAEQIGDTFRLFAHRYGLDARLAPLDTSQFRHPRPASGQLRLF
jgi:DNA repair photolyase